LEDLKSLYNAIKVKMMRVEKELADFKDSEKNWRD